MSDKVGFDNDFHILRANIYGMPEKVGNKLNFFIFNLENNHSSLKSLQGLKEKNATSSYNVIFTPIQIFQKYGFNSRVKHHYF